MSSSDKKLEILISNDDGIDAPGIQVLAAAMRRLGNVTVAAPHRQQSAVGHAITMSMPLRMRKYFIGKKFFGYAVEGTPADCVKLAVRSILKKQPDLMISGINHGSNTAVNILYSGTVSAATEGTILGIPSIAISLTTYDEPDFRFAAKFAVRLGRMVARHGMPRGTLLNVNVPAIPEREIKGVVVTRQGKSFWDDTFVARRDPINREYYWLTGKMEITDTAPDADQIAIINNYISITPIHYDLTDYAMLKELSRWNVGRLHHRDNAGKPASKDTRKRQGVKR